MYTCLCSYHDCTYSLWPATNNPSTNNPPSIDNPPSVDGPKERVWYPSTNNLRPDTNNPRETLAGRRETCTLVTMSGLEAQASAPKKRRVEYTLEQKVWAINANEGNSEAGKSMSYAEIIREWPQRWDNQVAPDKGVVSRWIRNKKKHFELAEQSERNLHLSRNREGNYPAVEKALDLWATDITNRGGNLVGATLLQKAQDLAQEAGYETMPGDKWLRRVKKMYGWGATMDHGEAGSAPQDLVNLCRLWLPLFFTCAVVGRYMSLQPTCTLCNAHTMAVFTVWSPVNG